MESDLQHQHHFLHGHNQHQQTHQKQMNPGLTRYQSAPSSYFSSNLDRDFCEEFLNRPTSPETERVFARFLANSGGKTEDISSSSPCEIKQDSPVRESISQINQQPQMVASMNIHSSDTRLHQNQQQQQQQSSYSASQGFYQSRSKPPLPDHNSGSGMNYRSMNSMGLGRLPSVKLSSGNNSNLVRHSSSPAGLFSDINIEFENGYAVLRGMGDPGAGKRDPAYSAAGRPPSSSGIMSPIAEMGNKNTGENSPDSGGFGEAPGNDYVSSYPIGSWDDSAMMSIDSKRHLTDDDRILSGLNSSETQNEEAGDRPPMLAHHLSLPKTSAEMATIEKLLQFQDSVPCKIRAKRGCATHPRSIAERVRRTRISERMRKLQDLVPNMDKQTNTSDMLDLAVDYIKDLQRQFKALSENRSRCTCVNKQQP